MGQLTLKSRKRLPGMAFSYLSPVNRQIPSPSNSVPTPATPVQNDEAERQRQADMQRISDLLEVVRETSAL